METQRLTEAEAAFIDRWMRTCAAVFTAAALPVLLYITMVSAPDFFPFPVELAHNTMWVAALLPLPLSVHVLMRSPKGRVRAALIRILAGANLAYLLFVLAGETSPFWLQMVVK